MMKPNWFDNEFGEKIAKPTAEQILEDIANSPRIIQALTAALAQHDANVERGMVGPSRSQVVRKTLAEVIQADD